MFRKLLLPCAAFAALTSCTLENPLPNARRFAAAQTEVWYEAAPGAAEAAAMAWSPTALLVYDENKVLYLAAGTRRIVELDRRDGSQRVLFDFAALENELNPSRTYDTTWGAAFLRVSDDVVVVAGAGRPLIWANLRTGAFGMLGEAARPGLAIPEPGMALGDVDFSLFSGIGRTHDGFVMSFESRVFRVAWDGADPESLRTATLQFLAGASERMTGFDPNDAASIALDLDVFTNFVENDGWVYFWDYPRLRAVREGRILTVTGDGKGTDSLGAFYATALPSSPALIEHNGDIYASYGKKRSVVLRIHVDSLDAQSGAVSGSLDYWLMGDSVVSQLASDGNGILGVDYYAGSVWRLSPDDGGVTRIFGPESEDAAFEDIYRNPQSPYRSHGLVAPLAIQSVLDDRAALVYLPSVGLLQFFDLETKTAQPLWNGEVTQIASDGQARAWLANGSYLYFVYLDDLSNIWLEYSSHFFRDVDLLGIPCTRDVMSLEGDVRIGASHWDLLVHLPTLERVVRIDSASGEATYTHEQGWVSPSDPKSFYNSGLMTGAITQWMSLSQAEASILQWQGRQWVAVNNTGGRELAVAGVVLDYDHGIVLFGAGDEVIDEGRSVATSSAQDVTAVALDVQRRLFVATHKGIFMAGDDGKWQATTGMCPQPGFAVTELRVAGREGQEIFFAKSGDALYACSVADTKIPMPMVAHTWANTGLQFAVGCSDGYHVVTTDGALVCSWQVAQKDLRCGKSPGEIADVACNDETVYVATTQPMVWAAPHREIGKFTQYAGHGDGLVNQEALLYAHIGADLGRMAADDIPFLHIWMRDTCTIWKIPAYRDQTIEADTIVTREMTDERLCHATAFAVTKAGRMAVVVDGALYLIRDGAMEKVSAVDVEILDMIGIGIGFVLLTVDGIYVWEDGDVRKVAPNPIEIDGESIDYAVPASVYPRMMQAPGENAVLIPVFARDRIVKIAL